MSRAIAAAFTGACARAPGPSVPAGATLSDPGGPISSDPADPGDAPDPGARFLSREALGGDATDAPDAPLLPFAPAPFGGETPFLTEAGVGLWTVDAFSLKLPPYAPLL